MRARTALLLVPLVAAVLSGCSSAADPAASDAPSSPGSSTAAPSTSVTPPTPAPSSSAVPSRSRSEAARTTGQRRGPGPTLTEPSRPTSAPPAPQRRPAAARLPLGYGTGDAGQVITVAAASGGSTTATLQRWRKVPGGWRRVGDAVFAYLGTDGVGAASESSSRTPAGSFTLTQAFGRLGDPGTRLPYFATTPDDYWISSPGAGYNTHQRCGSCGYDNGVNERLYGILPEYGQAVVIDYNTRNAPGGVRAGGGSAFFLHVAAGKPTQGCVSIPRDALVAAMRWLDPRQHPRILIGVPR